MQVELSDKTRELLEKFSTPCHTSHPHPQPLKGEGSGSCQLINFRSDDANPVIPLKHIIDWLSKTIDNSNRLVFEQCYASMLQDISAALEVADFMTPVTQEKEIASKNKFFSWLKYIGLLFAGVIYFACEGFDSMSAILSVFSPPGLVVLALGITFALLSVFIFIAFDLHQIAENLGIERKNVSELLDVYIEQLENADVIKKQTRRIDRHEISKEDIDEIAELLKCFKLKHQRLNELEEADYKKRKSLWYMVLLKRIAGVIAGTISFSAGFFTAQTAAIALVGLFLASASPASIPVIILCLCGGLAGFSLYYYVERPLVENFASWLLGLDVEKWDLLISTKNSQADSLEDAQVRVTLMQENRSLKESKQDKNDKAPVPVKASPEKYGANDFLFFPLPKFGKKPESKHEESFLQMEP